MFSRKVKPFLNFSLLTDIIPAAAAWAYPPRGRFENVQPGTRQNKDRQKEGNQTRAGCLKNRAI
jgi:hypothetical protein